MSEVPFFSFASKSEANIALANALFAAASAALHEGRRARIALSGGSTPEPAYKEFASRDLDWEKVDIALVDERWVDVDNDGSNEKMLRRAFSGSNANIIGMKNDAATPFAGAAELEKIYAKLAPFDAIVLGMGNDAHTASWFKDADGLEEILSQNCKQTVAGIDASHSEVGKAFPLRMTMTLEPVAKAKMVLLLIFGEEKKQVLNSALIGEVEEAPIKFARDAAQDSFVVFWAA